MHTRWERACETVAVLSHPPFVGPTWLKSVNTQLPRPHPSTLQSKWPSPGLSQPCNSFETYSSLKTMKRTLNIAACLCQSVHRSRSPFLQNAVGLAYQAKKKGNSLKVVEVSVPSECSETRISGEEEGNSQKSQSKSDFSGEITRKGGNSQKAQPKSVSRMQWYHAKRKPFPNNPSLKFIKTPLAWDSSYLRGNLWHLSALRKTTCY